MGLGTFAWSPLISSKLTGEGFFKLIATISVVSLFFTFLLILTTGEATFLFIGGAVFLLVLILIQRAIHTDNKTPLLWGLYALSLILGFIGIFVYIPKLEDQLFFISIALYYGLTLFLMVLGHYYLVVPKLTTKPLMRGSLILSMILVLKVIYSIIKAYHHQGFFVSGTELGGGYIYNWILLLMRFFWGFAGVGILNIMAYRCCKIQSTQSATGIFYIMVFFCIIGELISIFMWRNYGLAL